MRRASAGLLVRAECALLGLVAMFAPLALVAQPLFRSDSVLHVTITTNLRDLVRERDSTELEWFGAELVYADGDSMLALPVELRARGHFRRQRQNCDFPPLFLRIKNSVARGSELQGNPKIKIVSPCKPDRGEYQRYILLEYGVYRMYQELHPIHPRSRLARITYQDSSKRTDTFTVDGFFLELEEEVAKEHDVSYKPEFRGARFVDVHAPTLQSISLFALMVGNPDWSLGGLHNLYLVQDSIGLITPVAYDWDWVGLVNARYAFPDARLGIKRVTDRYYMGPCYTAAQWQPTLLLYQSKREQIARVLSSIPSLDQKAADDAVKYLADFWKLIEDPRALDRITKTCRKESN